MADAQHDADLAHVAHLATKLEELAELMRDVYRPSAERLWAHARPGARRLVGEIDTTINAQGGSPMPGSLASIVETASQVLSGERKGG
jgi:hypothetical protein